MAEQEKFESASQLNKEKKEGKEEGVSGEEEQEQEERTEKIEEAAERIEKEIPRSWKEMERKEEEKLFEKYVEKFELSEENQKFCDELLRREIEKEKIKYAKDWFEDHKEELQEEGISLDISEQKKISIALEKGALEELKTKKEYQEKYKEIENLNALKAELKKKHLPIDSQFLILNFLDKKTEEVEKEIQGMKKEKKPESEIFLKEKEFNNLFKTRKEVAERVSGRNLEEEVKTEIGLKDQYIGERLEDQKNSVKNAQEYQQIYELFKNEWESLSPKKQKKFDYDIFKFADKHFQKLNSRGLKMDKESYLALLNTDYNPAEFTFRGILRRKIQLKEGEIISRKKFPEFIQKQKEIYDKKVEKEAAEKLEKEYQKLTKEKIEEKIKKLAESPEKAVEGIEGMYKKIKERLIDEWAKKEFKKEKTEEELKRVKKEFGEGEVDLEKFIKKIWTERTGNLKKDKELLRKILRDYDVKIGKDDLSKLIESEKYKNNVKEIKGFLEFLLEVIISSFLMFSEKQAKRKRDIKKAK